MRWIVIAGAVLVALVLVVVLVGLALPTGHVASRTAPLPQPPETVWATITDVRAVPEWRRRVTEVEVLPPAEGRARWRERGRDGTITFETVEADPPRRLVSRIADPGLPFGGSWTYDIAPAPGGSTITITERGEVYNPIFRFVSRFIIGHQATMDAYLADLSARLGGGAVSAR